jgi:hypothetical protein
MEPEVPFNIPEVRGNFLHQPLCLRRCMENNIIEVDPIRK